MTVQASIVGGSGYTGGELTRLLLNHPDVEINQITSRSLAKKPVTRVNPNLRGFTKLKFIDPNELNESDLLFLCLPHGTSSSTFDEYKDLAPKIIDLSSDFRLNNQELYREYYGSTHPHPELLDKFEYGIAEINRDKIKIANYIATAGCNATASIIGMFPIIKSNLKIENVVIDVKVGSSESGRMHTSSSHHPERSGSLRSYKPTGHRHAAEVIEYLGINSKKIHFTATSVEMVRGVLATIHCFVDGDIDEKSIWKTYRDQYKNEPFVRVVKEKSGNYRFPDPKILSGTNFCDVGFEIDEKSNRIVIISALDNLMKGAAGQAVQAMNLIYGFDESTGLNFTGMHPR
ncbi:MAG: N-acetyl-gamma-glutamyl-phosphate/N-acetyl-gamma-aminoadipyl-phosphate reductase [Candidatus Heimdallarchaeota archaeon LC_2]|nr:MAG: N-acetyl-gamma-glutamyl-phosphate/N-acetyl-gamma-aminoadipyl-phosphate reductase [Candidatus Heimdallarchaeota archaeon LC_2]